MRIIDADAVLEELKRMEVEMMPAKLAHIYTAVVVEDAPTIDAVPVVRCRDCRWWDNSEDSPFGYCMAIKHGYMSENWEIGIYRRYKGDFYCADGERKDDEID